MNLKAKTVQGIGWSGLSQILQVLLQFIITAILARLLAPNDFGLLAMVLVFTNVVNIISDFGLSTALIQRTELTEEHLSSIFWLNIFIGIFLALILSFSSPLIAGFFNEDQLVPITIAIAASIFISFFDSVQTAVLTREMNFKVLNMIKIVSILGGGIIGVTMAFAGYGVWSLVWKTIGFCCIKVILSWTLCRWRPRALLKWLRVKELLKFGLNLTGFSIVNYISRNLDNLLIGRFLGSVSLGYYNLAYRLLTFPLRNISNVFGLVMFPSLSAIQDDKKKVCHAYLKTVRYIAVITFPVMTSLCIIAPQFVRVIYGPQWERSILLLQILAILGLVQSIVTLNGVIYRSQGRTDIQFRVGTIFAVLISISFVIGLRWDIEGVTIAYSATSILLTYPLLLIPFKLINLKFSDFLAQLKTVVFATIGMACLVFGIHYYLTSIASAGDFAVLFITVAAGIVCYPGLLFILDRPFFKETFELFSYFKNTPATPTSIDPHI